MTIRGALFVLLAVLHLGVGFPAASLAQGGWKRWGPVGRGYDPATVETVAGVVVRVERLPSGKGRSSGVGLTLRTEKETVRVLLGPAWYVEQQTFKLAPGDLVEITGSRVLYDGRPLLLAREVKKRDTLLKLRDQTGVPVWAGRKWSL